MAVYDFKSKKGGGVGRKTRLNPSLRGEHVKIIEEYAFTFRTLTAETLFNELEKLQANVCKKGAYNAKRRECLDLVKEEFKALDPYKLDKIWAIMFDNLRSILKNGGRSDYKPEHICKRKRQKDAGAGRQWI